MTNVSDLLVRNSVALFVLTINLFLEKCDGFVMILSQRQTDKKKSKYSNL